MISKAFLILMILVWVTGAHAFTCIERPFKTRVAQAQNIFVARITGGQVIENDEFPLKIPKVFATYEIVEHFKGTVPFDRLETSSAEGGIHFVVGGEYLIFAPDTGEVSSCSNDGALSPAEVRSERTALERDALRAVENGDFSTLVAPDYYGAQIAKISQPFLKCENQYPDGIEGIWGLDHLWTRREYLRAHPEIEMSSVNMSGGRSRTTITHNSIATEVADVGQIERNYRLVSSGGHRYALEQWDKSGETEVMTIEAVPCGLVMTTQYDCVSAFCTNARDEAFEMIAAKIGGGMDADQLKRLVDRAEQRRKSPRRLYYRQVLSEKPRTAE